MTEIDNINTRINSRYSEFFLDVKTAQLNLLKSDKSDQPLLSVIELEQSKTVRSLLRVEKQAIREKDLNIKQANNSLKDYSNQINQFIEQRMIEEFKSTENIYQKVLGIEPAIPELLDLLTLESVTISRIESLLNEVPWFNQELLKMANQPKYHRAANKVKAPAIDNSRVAIRLFGIENLSSVVLSLLIRRWLPQITDPYPSIKNRIWEEALATGMTSRKLASVYKIEENQALNLGMLQIIGTIVIVKLYFRLFDTVQREQLIEAQSIQSHEQHSSLSRMMPSGNFLTQLIEKHALSVSSDLINMMGMKRVCIAYAMKEIANTQHVEEISPLALACKQASGYSRYRLLKMHNLIDKEEAKQFIISLNVPKGALQLLKTVDIGSFNLVSVNP